MATVTLLIKDVEGGISLDVQFGESCGHGWASAAEIAAMHCMDLVNSIDQIMRGEITIASEEVRNGPR